MKSRSLVFEAAGPPGEVLQVRERELPELAEGGIVVQVIAAPINPADINFIQGTYGKKPVLPARAGMEGVGRVVQTRAAGAGIAEGDLVLLPPGAGSWSEHCVVAANDVVPVPPSLDPLQAAMMRVNPPTALRMLRDFVTLDRGGWLIQNAANSGVGRCVIRMARHFGWKSVNVVRRAELVPELEAEGADVVILDDRESFKSVPSRTGGAPLRLGLNAVGGDNALGVAASLAEGGVHVTYGAMGMAPLKIPNGLLIFKDLRFRGFWVTRWFESAPPAERDALFAELVTMLEAGILHVPVAATYGIDDFREAVGHAMQGGRAGKVLFRLG